MVGLLSAKMWRVERAEGLGAILVAVREPGWSLGVGTSLCNPAGSPPSPPREEPSCPALGHPSLHRSPNPCTKEEMSREGASLMKLPLGLDPRIQARTLLGLKHSCLCGCRTLAEGHMGQDIKAQVGNWSE